MSPARPIVIVVAAVSLGCGGPQKMSGFAEIEARAANIHSEPVDACSLRSGRLLIEVAQVVINEYPHHVVESHAQQPLVVMEIAPLHEAPGRSETQAWVAPPTYKSGQEVDVFRTLRILDRPLRALADRRLVFRLGENDRTEAPRWAQTVSHATGAVGAVSLLGLPSPPAGLLAQGIELVRNLDKDDLVLLWETDGASLGQKIAKAPLRLRLETSRHTKDGNPSAVVTLLAFIVPETGCGEAPSARP